MADPADKISQLKIDRSMPAAAERRWLLPVIIVTIAGVIVVWWLFFSAGSSAVLAGDGYRPQAAERGGGQHGIGCLRNTSSRVVKQPCRQKFTGKVIDVFVEEGMRVEKDQVVAALDDTTQQAQLLLARARAESARATLDEFEAQLRIARLERDRFRDLIKRSLTSQSSVDTAEATFDQIAAQLETGRQNVKVAERNVELAKDSLSNMTIKAPFAGMVVSKNAQPGEMISPISAGGRLYAGLASAQLSTRTRSRSKSTSMKRISKG